MIWYIITLKLTDLSRLMLNSLSPEPIYSEDFAPESLAAIYDEAITMAAWRRRLSEDVTHYAQWLVGHMPSFQTRVITNASHVGAQLNTELPDGEHKPQLIDDVCLVVDMFSCLFELENVGLRLAVLQKPMCPKFHVDRVPCRLLCTYVGEGTEWLDNQYVQRPDGGKVITLPTSKPNQLAPGDVALLKGESWEGNEGRGLVHRSPYASNDQPRLVLTLDFA